MVVLALCVSISIAHADLWINEFHYDNDGTDTGEFVEVVVAPNMSMLDLSTVALTLYNGSNGQAYGSHLLSTFLPGAVVNGFSFYTLSLPSNGIQNGAPDGLALSISGVLVPGQFLSYEGAFTATDGPISGAMSTDIGVSEAGTTPVGQSLQLVGTGAEYSDFTWASPMANTLGTLNTGQVAVPEPGALLFGGLVCSAVGVVAGWRRVFEKKAD